SEETAFGGNTTRHGKRGHSPAPGCHHRGLHCRRAPPGSYSPSCRGPTDTTRKGRGRSGSIDGCPGKRRRSVEQLNVVEISPEYLAARRTLLDALAALEPHLDNLILVGAQAVYLHAGAGDVSVAPMTTDADLALDARGLADSPEISAALSAAGFVAGSNPGA